MSEELSAEYNNEENKEEKPKRNIAKRAFLWLATATVVATGGSKLFEKIKNKDKHKEKTEYSVKDAKSSDDIADTSTVTFGQIFSNIKEDLEDLYYNMTSDERVVDISTGSSDIEDQYISSQAERDKTLFERSDEGVPLRKHADTKDDPDSLLIERTNVIKKDGKGNVTKVQKVKYAPVNSEDDNEIVVDKHSFKNGIRSTSRHALLKKNREMQEDYSIHKISYKKKQDETR